MQGLLNRYDGLKLGHNGPSGLGFRTAVMQAKAVSGRNQSLWQRAYQELAVYSNDDETNHNQASP